MANMKCKYCEKVLIKKEAYIISEKNLIGKEKKIFLHEKCVDNYKELIEYKQNEIAWFKEICEYLKEVLNYTDEQKLPKQLITRIQDMRNGTIIERGIGRVVKSKEGYSYQVILDTLLSISDKIAWSFTNKTFDTETKKINYLMAIVDSNINDIYIRHKNQGDTSNIKKRDNLIEEEKQIIDIPINKIEIIYKNTGISKFLDNDDM